MEGTGATAEARSRPSGGGACSLPPLRHAARNWAAVVVFGVAALAAFAMLGDDVLHNETAAFDTGVRGWMLSHQTAWLSRFLHLVSTVGSVTPMVAYAAIGAVVLWLRRKPLVASSVLVAPAVAVVAYLALKHAFARSRPSGLGNLIEGTYSFPSAHATTSAAICSTLAYVFWRERLVPGAVALLAAVTVPLLVGVSRVYLDVHWATDVVGGWCAGLVIAALSAGLYNSSRHFRTPRIIHEDRT